jgi:hypothetical protein
VTGARGTNPRGFCIHIAGWRSIDRPVSSIKHRRAELATQAVYFRATAIKSIMVRVMLILSRQSVTGEEMAVTVLGVKGNQVPPALRLNSQPATAATVS